MRFIKKYCSNAPFPLWHQQTQRIFKRKSILREWANPRTHSHLTDLLRPRHSRTSPLSRQLLSQRRTRHESGRSLGNAGRRRPALDYQTSVRLHVRRLADIRLPQTPLHRLLRAAGNVSMGEPCNNCTHTACSYRRDRPEFPRTRRQRRNRRLPGSRKGEKRIRYRRRFPAILVLGRFSPRRINYRLPQRFPAATLQHPDYLFNHRIFPANCISNSLVNCRRKNQQKNRLWNGQRPSKTTAASCYPKNNLAAHRLSLPLASHPKLRLRLLLFHHQRIRLSTRISRPSAPRYQHCRPRRRLAVSALPQNSSISSNFWLVNGHCDCFGHDYFIISNSCEPSFRNWRSMVQHRRQPDPDSNRTNCLYAGAGTLRPVVSPRRRSNFICAADVNHKFSRTFVPRRRCTFDPLARNYRSQFR